MISAQYREGLHNGLASQLRGAAMERLLSSHPFSCAWVGRKSELVLPSSDGLGEVEVDTHLAALYEQALYYWRIKGADSVGDDVVGYTSAQLGIGSVGRVTVVGEDDENWALKLVNARNPERPHSIGSRQIAVVGGEIVKASFVDRRSRTPMTSLDLQSLCQTLRRGSRRRGCV